MYLIDTNIIIYFLNNNSNVIHFLDGLTARYISHITYIEVLSYPYSRDELAIVERFLQENFIILPITHDIATLTAQNRRSRKTKTPDAIIGATAVYHHCTLVTNNIKDFDHLSLNLINPLV